MGEGVEVGIHVGGEVEVGANVCEVAGLTVGGSCVGIELGVIVG